LAFDSALNGEEHRYNWLTFGCLEETQVFDLLDEPFGLQKLFGMGMFLADILHPDKQVDDRILRSLLEELIADRSAEIKSVPCT
jgi:hypothetical protein